MFHLPNNLLVNITDKTKSAAAFGLVCGVPFLPTMEEKIHTKCSCNGTQAIDMFMLEVLLLQTGRMHEQNAKNRHALDTGRGAAVYNGQQFKPGAAPG